MTPVPDIAATTTGSPGRALRDLRRDPGNGMVAGVCEGIGRQLDLDPLLVRIVFGARNRRAALEVGSGVGFRVIALLLAFRELGPPFSDALTWPLVLVAAGGALIWRQSVGRPGSRGAAAAPASGPARAAIAPPLLPDGGGESRPAVIHGSGSA